MRVVMVSKALVVGAYQRKLEEIAAYPDVELTLVVPKTWAGQPYERRFTHGYRTLVEPISLDGNFHLFRIPSLGRILRKIRPDIVHVDEEPYNLATAHAVWHARRVGARPLFFTWQNLPRRYPPPFRWFERYVYSRVAHAIAGNAEAVDVLRGKGYRGPTSVIPQFGVDPDLFKPAPAGHPTDRPFTIGYVGRLTLEKGLDVLVDAVARLDGAWRLRLVGSGEYGQVALSRAWALGIGERVTVEPYVSSVEVPALLRSLDVLVLPSLTRPNWKEQFGRVLIEAMACEVPVIGSDSGEIPNVIGDGGLIVCEGDSQQLCSSLERLRADQTLRVQLGRQGRQRVLDRFTHASIAAQTVEVYRRVLAG